jgi:hypothetical protein
MEAQTASAKEASREAVMTFALVFIVIKVSSLSLKKCPARSGKTGCGEPLYVSLKLYHGRPGLSTGIV